MAGLLFAIGFVAMGSTIGDHRSHLVLVYLCDSVAP